MSLSVELVLVFMAPIIGGTVIMRSGQSVQTPTTCDAGPFVEGTDATVVCHFDQLKQLAAFTLLHYPVNLADGSEKTAVVCLRSQESEVFCQQAHGYSLDPPSANLTTDSVTIKIRAVKIDQAGYYACHTIPPEENVTVNWCRLSVLSQKDVTTTLTPGKLQQAENPCSGAMASNAGTGKDVDTLSRLTPLMVMVYMDYIPRNLLYL